MTDIVHWLRKLADLVDDGHHQCHVVAHMRAGADEIEKLRAALKKAASDLDDWGAYTKANNARAMLDGSG